MKTKINKLNRLLSKIKQTNIYNFKHHETLVLSKKDEIKIRFYSDYIEKQELIVESVLDNGIKALEKILLKLQLVKEIKSWKEEGI